MKYSLNEKSSNAFVGKCTFGWLVLHSYFSDATFVPMGELAYFLKSQESIICMKWAGLAAGPLRIPFPSLQSPSPSSIPIPILLLNPFSIHICVENSPALCCPVRCRWARSNTCSSLRPSVPRSHPRRGSRINVPPPRSVVP